MPRVDTCDERALHTCVDGCTLSDILHRPAEINFRFVLHSTMLSSTYDGNRASPQFDRGRTITELQLHEFCNRRLVDVRTGSGAEAEGVRLDANRFFVSIPCGS